MLASIVVLSALIFVPPAEGNKNELLELFTSKGASVSVRDSKREAIGLNRIVGGDDADPTQYPFFSLIEIAKLVTDGDVTDVCGGSLVAPDIVLTAAHCFAEGEILNTTVTVNNTARNNLTGYEYIRDVVEIVIHPDYEIATFKNDIALLVLDSPVAEVTPVTLNSDSSTPIDGEDLQVIGMGLLKEQGDNDDGVFPDFLQVATVQSISVAVCAAAYANTPDGDNIPVDTTLQFCAAAPGKDACAADSGGPIVRTSGSSSLLIGTVSFGYGCAIPEYPGVYARISTYKSYIEQEICDLSSSPPGDCDSLAPTIAPVAATSPPVPLPQSNPSQAPIPQNPPSRAPTPRAPVPQSSPSYAPTPAVSKPVSCRPSSIGHDSKSKKGKGRGKKGMIPTDDDYFGFDKKGGKKGNTLADDGESDDDYFGLGKSRAKMFGKRLR